MSHDHHHPSEHHPHVMPLSMYFSVAGALIVLTIATVWTAKFMPELIFKATKMQVIPEVAIVIALVIASIKAALVCLFFMHLKYDKPLNRLAFVSGLFFLSLFFIFTLADVMTRSNMPTAAEPNLTPALTPALTSQQKEAVMSYYEEEFEKLTERPPTPHWIEAWYGFNDKGEKLDENGNVIKGH